MRRPNSNLAREVQELENVVFVCFGSPKGDELPQVATEEDIVIDLVHSSCAHKSLQLVDCEIHHQTDPSYQ